MRKRAFQLHIKKKWSDIFVSMEYHLYRQLKISCFKIFGDEEYGSFEPKSYGNMIFTGYCKVLVLNFSEIRNTVFFWAKKLTKIWYLLITGKFFSVMGNRSFSESRSWWKDDIYVVFFSFLWYSRTWEIWFFAQCYLCIINFIKEL